MYQILNYWHILHVHLSPAQLFIFCLKRASVGSFFMLSSRVLHRKLPLNTMDSTPYDIVFAFGSLERFVFLKHISHNFSFKIPIQSMDSCYLMTCIFHSLTFVDFLREWYSSCYAVEAIGTMNRNHFKVSLIHVYVHDLFSYLHIYCRIAISKGNN